MYLDKIIHHKREEVQNLRIIDKKRSRDLLDPIQYLREKPFIAEVKKASPSMGDINSGIDVVHQAQRYETGGAGAISVLTDSRFFKGDIGFLSMISDNVGLPVLCKDFIIYEKQIENAYRAGADFILLIAAVLDREEIEQLSGIARELDLEILYEIHGLNELDKIEGLDPRLVGVNSRDLKTFEIDMNRAGQTIRQLEGNFLKIAESGIAEPEHVRFYKKSGADAFLIGTSLMKAEDPAERLNEYYGAL